ncbi:MAG: heme-degrading [Holophagaceae bacterium]|nr:heme-degrading [Holophagaceae bacterium]
MFMKVSIGLEEAMGAIQAMLDEVRSNPDRYWQHGGLAVVDDRGKLIAFAKMDSSHQIPGDVAIRKAWTAAICCQDNDRADAMLKKGGALLEEFCAGGTSIPGGVAIFDLGQEGGDLGPGHAQPPFRRTCMGAIGVGGVGLPPEDYAVAMVGLRHIQQRLWPGQEDAR